MGEHGDGRLAVSRPAPDEPAVPHRRSGRR
jgi:hypothetical protein